MLQVILEEQTPNLPPMDDVKAWIEENKSFLKDFLNYARNEGRAIGLASNQVSYNGHRILDRFMAINYENKWHLAVNPSIIQEEGEPVECDEGCLTWPNSTVIATRYPKVMVEFHTLEGKLHTRRVRNLLESQVWQHEINHLNGVEEKVVDNGFRTVRREKAKVSRNASCPCGSNKKYKHCCLRSK